ncbi:MAG: PaaI family thioesterase [Gammaproteobacteria bacterium]|jgi:uncharacterized protein (TIGR00369 family)
MSAPSSDDALGAVLGIAGAEGTFLDVLGLRQLEWSEGRARLALEVKRHHTNTVGLLHGGVILSLLDVGGAMACLYGHRERYVAITVNQNTSFVSAHRSRQALVEARLIGKGRRLCFTETKVIDSESDTLCATALGTYNLFRRERGSAGKAATRE